MPPKSVPAIILGGGGYVGGEVIRLLASHPEFRIEAVISQTFEGQDVSRVFPHLMGIANGLSFTSMDRAHEIVASRARLAVFSAMPHGETAAVLANLLREPNQNVSIVDMSADFRFSFPDQYKSVYRHPHPNPELIPAFTCAVPELEFGVPTPHFSHPGCFTTCITLAAAPLIAQGIVKPKLRVSAVTGSTGAGRTPRPGTHHPDRQSAMWAYDPLRHRHQPEMEMLLSRFGPEASVSFVPHSGSFSRGIHATIFLDLEKDIDQNGLIHAASEFYASSPFIQVSERLPSVKEVAGSNRCHIGIARQGDEVIVTSVIDNLVKGAAGGSVQWMNRIFGFDHALGLEGPATGWI